MTGYLGHDEFYAVPATGILPVNLRYSPANRDSHDMDFFRSRDSPKLRNKAYTKSEAGFRDQFTFMNSNQAIPSKYRPFPGFQNMIQRSMTSGGSVPGEASPSIPCDENNAPDDPFTSPPGPRWTRCRFEWNTHPNHLCDS